MKKVLVLAVALVLGLGLAAFAAGTTVDVTWDFSGGTGLTVNFANGDDSNSSLYTAGSHAWGEFHGVDSDDNPYSYGVDSGSFSTKAYVENGGGIKFDVQRTDSHTSMYGPSGQEAYSEVWTADGSAFIGTRASTNFAEARTCNYGWQASSQYTASGSVFYLDHWIKSGDGDQAGVHAAGSGSADVTLMSDEMHGSSFRLGRGCGCYTDAKASGTGAGEFDLWANAGNSLSGYGWSAPGGGSYLQQIKYNGGFSADNIYVDGH